MRVAVDETGDGAAAPAVELVHLAAERPEVAHPTDGGDRLAVHEDVGVLEHVDVCESGAAQRGVRARRARHLRQVAQQEH
jgi:hypothetical protein